MHQIVKDIAAHLAKQREQSKKVRGDNDSYCSYRGDEGLMCAVGCLIPDEMYNVDLEGMSAAILLEGNPNIRLHIMDKYKENDVRFVRRALTAAQNFHDSYAYYNILHKGGNDTEKQLANRIASVIDSWIVK